VAQNEKRLRKLERASSLVPPPKRFGPPSAEISVVCFGTTKMPVREAMKWLEVEGHPVELLQIVTLWPFPAEDVSAFLDSARMTLVVEGNATGQLEGLVAERCLRTFDERLRRYDGRPISPELVYAKIKQLLGEPVQLSAAGAVAAAEEGAR
jgi:pyruvate/2-oxoacid:ferredoxin oxidoreductase alpha subunit